MLEEQMYARNCLQELLDLDEGLTRWEVDFIESLSNWSNDFTPKQIETIYKIYERKC